MATDLQPAGTLYSVAANDFILAPGYELSALLVKVYPGILAGAGEPSALLVAGLAIAFWLTTVLLAAAALRRLLRFMVAIGLGLRLRLEHVASRVRIWLLVRVKKLDWRRYRSGSTQEEIELDDVDLAVLDHGSTLPPGFAISVIELSQTLGARPSRIEGSLDKLRRHKLVDPLMGSSDGYGNYQLTDSGAWYIAAHKRSEPLGSAAGQH